MPKPKINEQVEDLLSDFYVNCTDYKPDGREFLRADKVAEYAQKIIDKIRE